MQVVDIEGKDVRGFLRHALANNVDKLKVPGKALYSCLLNEQGGVIDDLIAYFFREDYFRLVVNAGTAAKDIAWLGLAAKRGRRACDHAAQRPRDHRDPGPERARALLGRLSRASRRDRSPEALQRGACRRHDGGAHRLHRRGRLRDRDARDGAESVMEGAGRAGRAPCGLGARDTLRLEAGMNLYGQDMDESVSPLDAGLAWTVDLESPRDFVGKAALAAKGKQREFLGLVLTESGGVLRGHQKTLDAAAKAKSRAARFSPTLSQSIALARLPLGTRPATRFACRCATRRSRRAS
jgi:aminomethyltransferase